jgi:hypothetical protein
MTSGGKRYTNRLHAEATRWQHVAGEPTAADSAGPYSHEQLVRMDADFVGAVERAFTAALESPHVAAATYDSSPRSRASTCSASEIETKRPRSAHSRASVTLSGSPGS